MNDDGQTLERDSAPTRRKVFILERVPVVIVPDDVDLSPDPPEVSAESAPAADPAPRFPADSADTPAREEAVDDAAVQREAQDFFVRSDDPKRTILGREGEVFDPVFEEYLRRADELEDPDFDRFLARVEGEIDHEIDEELAPHPDDEARSVRFTWACRAAGAFVVSLAVVLAVIGWRYYVLTPSLRPLHYLHALLRPSGVLGLSLGFAGTALMAASMYYFVRKRSTARVRPSATRAWLEFHMLAGVIGPILIAFHSAFIPHSVLGMLAFTAMAIVVVSGVAGRFVYKHVPRYLEGRENEFETIRLRLAVYRRKLIQLGFDPKIIALDDEGSRRGPLASIATIVNLVRGDPEGQRDLARLKRAAKRCQDSEAQRALALAVRLWGERRWLVRCRELRGLIGAWRFFHRWLAIVLLFGIVFHVAIALGFGDLFGRR